MSDIFALVPRDKFDSSGINILKSIDGEKIEPILGALLEWMQDLNWPVAKELIQVLPRFHCQLVPHIQAVFQSNDDIWKNWILVMLEDFPLETVKLLSGDIKRMACSPSESERLQETDMYAKVVIDRFKL